MGLSLQESGLMPQLLVARDNAVALVGASIRVNGWDQETHERVSKVAELAANNAIEQTLQIFDAEGFFTKTENTNGTVGIVDVVYQDMAEEWVKAINT